MLECNACTHRPQHERGDDESDDVQSAQQPSACSVQGVVQWFVLLDNAQVQQAKGVTADHEQQPGSPRAVMRIMQHIAELFDPDDNRALREEKHGSDDVRRCLGGYVASG